MTNRAVSLFSNCGAGDVGYRQAGFRFDVMAELNADRMRVCLLNHPGATGVVGDLQDTWKTVVSSYREKAGNEAPALLCACPPCQGMSSARSGKGRHDDPEAGSKDERNLLVTVISKVVKALEPKLVVVENVPAFLTRQVWHPVGGYPISAASYLIGELSPDYQAYPMVSDLVDFGVPQSRKRAFLVFVRRSIPAFRLLSERGEAPFPAATHVGPGSAGALSLAQTLAGFGLPSLDGSAKEKAQARDYSDLHSVPVWPPRLYDMVAAIPPNSGRSAWDNSSCVKCGHSTSNAAAVVCEACSAPLPKPTVVDHDGTLRLVRGFKSSYRRMHPDRPAATITTASGHVGSDYTIHPSENRLLSTLECALLQTFPANFRWGVALKDTGHTGVRAMIGEAVPPAFTKMHGAVLIQLLGQRGRKTRIAIDDPRCVKGRDKLARAEREAVDYRAAADSTN